ncbi:ferredoxin reductase [Halomonas piscis]|uniref:ferredoxin reductase n=1 Tax=Halomonas piscis TaxID=3031727 RepID=UPI0028A29C94|nr:ferredoxin reductase [Halomonas piscis]
MPKSIHRVTTVIKSISDEFGVRRIKLGDVDDWPLPPFTAGAHIDVYLPSGKVRHYSLCGDPADNSRYHIAVKRDANSRGGSIEVHETLKVGQELLISLPRNFLPLTYTEGCVIMVAGGIGITPFLSMLPELERRDAKYLLHYCTRSPAATPLKDMLHPYDKKVNFYHSETRTRMDIKALIDNIGDKDHLYICGPTAMLHAAEELGAHLGNRLHIEYFGVGETSSDPA